MLAHNGTGRRSSMRTHLNIHWPHSPGMPSKNAMHWEDEVPLVTGNEAMSIFKHSKHLIIWFNANPVMRFISLAFPFPTPAFSFRAVRKLCLNSQVFECYTYIVANVFKLICNKIIHLWLLSQNELDKRKIALAKARLCDCLFARCADNSAMAAGPNVLSQLDCHV